MFGLPQRIPVVVIWHIPPVHFISSAGMGALSAPPWCVLSILCNTTHAKTMALTTFTFAPLCQVKYP